MPANSDRSSRPRPELTLGSPVAPAQGGRLGKAGRTGSWRHGSESILHYGDDRASIEQSIGLFVIHDLLEMATMTVRPKSSIIRPETSLSVLTVGWLELGNIFAELRSSCLLLLRSVLAAKEIPKLGTPPPAT